MYFGCDVNLFEWMFEFLHVRSAHLNGCDMLCPMVEIPPPQHMMVCSLLGLSCADGFIKVNQGVT